MSDEQKYCELLKEVGAFIKEKNSEIDYLKFRCGDLEQKLKAAEAQIEAAKRDC